MRNCMHSSPSRFTFSEQLFFLRYFFSFFYFLVNFQSLRWWKKTHKKVFLYIITYTYYYKCELFFLFCCMQKIAGSFVNRFYLAVFAAIHSVLTWLCFVAAKCIIAGRPHKIVGQSVVWYIVPFNPCRFQKTCIRRCTYLLPVRACRGNGVLHSK